MIDVQSTKDTPGLAKLFDASTPDRARLYAVLEGRAPGRILVDQVSSPSCCIVQSSCFGRVFFGGTISRSTVSEVVHELRADGVVRLDMTDPCAAGFPPDAMIDPRLEFCGRLSKLTGFRELLGARPDNCDVRQIDAEAFEMCQWRGSVLGVFGSPANYLEHSVGFSVSRSLSLVSEAHAYFWGGGLVEIGAITGEQHRGRGYALLAVSHLVEECERRGYTTYWGCDISNVASSALARRLGYGEPREYSVGVYLRV